MIQMNLSEGPRVERLDKETKQTFTHVAETWKKQISSLHL